MVGADICGFNGNTTASLCLRWMQLGAFYPFARNHNTDDAIDQDPVALGEDVVRASREALEIRYLLLPYLYSLFFRAHLTGETVARPLFFEFYKDKMTYGIDTQFMWGSGLMIVPILQENVIEVQAYIPGGVWYDLYNGSPRPGTGDFQMLYAPNNGIPLLIRGGNILPAQWPGSTTTESRRNAMVLIVALDEKQTAVGEFFWDDGDSLDPVGNQNYTHVLFTAAPGIVTVNITVVGYDGPLKLNYLSVLGIAKDIDSVTVDGEEVKHHYNATNEVLDIFGFERSLLSNFSVIWNA
ncbi:hypothetical protein SK128_004599 [Halocaridina rubra]|uniref:Uncharacterized protein n=1 Tax=Halocaridina rubra TaxID=373956 RepID=A0AAN9AC86_HALRR